MWHVYILLCSNGSLYTGISLDSHQRYIDHKSGKGGRYTRMFKPVKLVYTEKVGTKSQALKREKQIKGWDRKKKIKVLDLKL